MYSCSIQSILNRPCAEEGRNKKYPNREMREKGEKTWQLKTKIMLGRTGKITIVAAMVLLLTIGTFVVVNQPTTIAGKTMPPSSPHWSLRLPSSYSGMQQLFTNFFPELTASKFHYFSPNLAGETPSFSLTINLGNITIKTTDLSFLRTGI